jgi:Raf kinase inhibitor-like YbhB/YbcL family protein
MKIVSPEFKNNESIPGKFTCDGEGINPPLEISEIPKGTKALALIVNDPDAPSGDYIHWLLADFEPVLQIAEGSTPNGATRGTNSSGSLDYIAPCPPSGTHRYYFKVYALSDKLNLKEGFSQKDLEGVLVQKTLESSELICLYQRNN